MLALRLILILVGALIVLSLLGYALNKDPRWLKFAGLSLKSALALIGLLMLVYLVERLILVL
jgi:NADH:ubiquinone oxidoreductase subunit 6 (subunit J)